DAERAAILERSVGFGVPGVDVAGAAGHPQEDDAGTSPDGLSRSRRRGTLPEQRRHGQSRDAGEAGLEQVAPAEQDQPLAIERVEGREGVLLMRWAADFPHGITPRRTIHAFFTRCGGQAQEPLTECALSLTRGARRLAPRLEAALRSKRDMVATRPGLDTIMIGFPSPCSEGERPCDD